MSRRMVYRVVWIPSLVTVLVMTVAYGREGYHAPPPGKLVPYTSNDRALTVLHPENWPGHELTMNAVMTTISFDPAFNAHFEAQSDLEGSLLADAARPAAPEGGGTESGDASGSSPAAGGVAAQIQGLTAHIPGLGSLPGASTKPPLEASHDSQGASMAKDDRYSGFKDGQTNPVQLAGFAGLATEFAFHQGSLFSKTQMAGLRVTALSGDRHIAVVYYYPLSEKSAFEPIFAQMLESVTPGAGGNS